MRGPYGPPKEALFLLASRAARHMSGSSGRGTGATPWHHVQRSGKMLPRRGQNKLAQGNALGTFGNKTDVAVTCEKPDSSRVQHQVPSSLDCQELSQCLVCVSGWHLQRMGQSGDHDRRRRGSRPCAVRPFEESSAEEDRRGSEEGELEVDEDRRPKES